MNYYSKVLFFIFRCLKYIPVDLFLDIGTNYGECLLSVPLYAKTKIQGYEANPYLSKYIHKSIKHNDDIKNIEVLQVAVSKEAGKEITLYIDSEWSGKSSAFYKPPNSKKNVNVSTTTIDEQVKCERGIKNILI